ncbi:hypothetical protein [Streptomyces sp. N35]|uniref:hypothetical protein n=1 Tax=Streptomyces sp. N35 TaxID=2795730 RepID=UPI0018F774CE|nr:hypothetical protein [Streptomyces sp. N35]
MPETMGSVLTFISRLPDPTEVAKIQIAAAEQLRALDKKAYADVGPGREARINDTLNPPYLRGLTGTVQEANRTGSRFKFLLDEESTRILRRDPRNTKFRIPDGVERYRLPVNGIPVRALELIDTK